jgi:hypothetical protein
MKGFEMFEDIDTSIYWTRYHQTQKNVPYYAEEITVPKIDDQEVVDHIHCGKCDSTQFDILCGHYECWAICSKCKNAFLFYDG